MAYIYTALKISIVSNDNVRHGMYTALESSVKSNEYIYMYNIAGIQHEKFP